jgi:putative selenate reductase
VIVSADGSVRFDEEVKQFAIDREHQIANYADFCNECGNCDTFCPEYGGPYIKKPGFYSTRDSYVTAAPRDGFLVCNRGRIMGRIRGIEYELIEHRDGEYIFLAERAGVTIWGADFRVESMGKPEGGEARVDMGIFHTLRYLLHGVLDPRSVNQVNVEFIARAAATAATPT